jgi:hypothetical protein
MIGIAHSPGDDAHRQTENTFATKRFRQPAALAAGSSHQAMVAVVRAEAPVAPEPIDQHADSADQANDHRSTRLKRRTIRSQRLISVTRKPLDRGDVSPGLADGARMNRL